MKFKINYIDPETLEQKTIIRHFKDTETVTAKEWAEDFAYNLTDKGSYEIEELEDGN